MRWLSRVLRWRMLRPPEWHPVQRSQVPDGLVTVNGMLVIPGVV